MWAIAQSKWREYLVRIIVIGLFLLPWLQPFQGVAVNALPGWFAAMLAISVLLFRFLNIDSDGYWIWALLLAACLSALAACLQFIGKTEIANGWIAVSTDGQMYANLRQRNQLATLLIIGWMAALHVIVQTNNGLRKGWISVLVLLMMTLVATASRTGLLQMVVVLTTLTLMHRRCQKGIVGLAWISAVLYLMFILIMPRLSTWVNGGEVNLLMRFSDPHAFSRIELWSNVTALISQKPWLGHGWRGLAYAHYSTEFLGERFMEMLDNAHNLPLHLAVEFGIPAALGFCILVIWLIWKGRPWKETRSDRQLAWGILLVIGIHSMLEYPLWYGPFFMTALICIAILSADLWKKWFFTTAVPTQIAILLGVRGFAALLLVSTAFVAFDYHRVSQIYLQPEQRSSWYAADPLAAAKQSLLFQDHAKFAELQITPLSRETAPRVLELASELVHWSPEPRIIEKLIESAVMMQRDDLAMFHLQRFRTAYPQAYALWVKRN